MHKPIIVSFSPHTDPVHRAWVSEKVNSVLETVKKEVNSWNGFVDYVETEPGYFVVIGKCDNEEIREVMQILLDKGFPKTNTETPNNRTVLQRK